MTGVRVTAFAALCFLMMLIVVVLHYVGEVPL